MKALKLGLFSILILLITAACENVVPEFDNLTSIAPPTFNGKKAVSQSTFYTNSTFNVNGECAANVENLVFRINGYKEWASASEFATATPTVDCSGTQSFSFTLDTLANMGVWDLSEPQTIVLEARAITSQGYSNPSKYIIYYKPPGDASPYKVRAGGGTSTSSSHKVISSIKTLSGKVSKSTNHSVVQQ